MHCWFLLRFLVPNIFVFAIFSQFLPVSATIHPCRMNFYQKMQLFSLYNMSEVEWGQFQNQPFSSYLLNPFTNQNNFCGYLPTTFYVLFHPSNLLGCTSAQSLGNFFTMDKIWICRQNVALIFKFSYRYTYLGLP